jgi:hypothetical protein
MKFSKAADMVDMSVRADDGADLQPMATNDREDSFHFVARVHDDGFPCRRIAQDRAVALKHADRNYFVNEFLRHENEP